ETANLKARLLETPESEDHARWLLAQLLEYHQREARPVWWAYFDRVAMLPEDLENDSEAISFVEPDPDVPPYKEKMSLVHTLRFPAQDFKLSSLRDVRDEEGRSTGELLNAWVDTTGGHALL